MRIVLGHRVLLAVIRGDKCNVGSRVVEASLACRAGHDHPLDGASTLFRPRPSRSGARTPRREQPRQVGEADDIVTIEILDARRARTPRRKQLGQVSEADDLIPVEIASASTCSAARSASSA
jgi:hypothetical protein